MLSDVVIFSALFSFLILQLIAGQSVTIGVRIYAGLEPMFKLWFASIEMLNIFNLVKYVDFFL